VYPKVYRTLRRFFPGGPETRRHLRELERTQWLARYELEREQLARLKALVAYAYEQVPYYRELYRRNGVRPEAIRSFRDFQQVPFLTKEEVNNNLNSLISPEFSDRVKPDSTGGSTGQPMRFFIDKSFHWWDAALEFRGRRWYGVSEGDKIAWVWGAARDMHIWSRKARLKAKIQQNRYLNAFDITDEKMKAFAEMLVRWRPEMFRAYASALSLFARYLKEHGITGIRPKLIETTAEKVTDPQRELLEEVFGCKVADWYTARELGTIGFQCPQGGMHVCETRYLEVIANGKPAAPGELGEVVVTSLHQYAMPVIRYKIGDMAIYDPKPCPCGRGLPVLREVVGRIQDFLVTADGHFVHGGYFPHTFREWPEIKEYQVYQPNKASLEVRIVCGKRVDSVWLERLRAEVQNRFGPGTRIVISIVDNIPLTKAGKHRFIISDVKPDFI